MAKKENKRETNKKKMGELARSCTWLIEGHCSSRGMHDDVVVAAVLDPYLGCPKCDGVHLSNPGSPDGSISRQLLHKQRTKSMRPHDCHIIFFDGANCDSIHLSHLSPDCSASKKNRSHSVTQCDAANCIGAMTHSSAIQGRLL